MNAATWTVTISLTEVDAEVSARAVLRAGGKVFEGSGTAGVNPHDVVRPAPGAAHAAERALLDLVESIRCARLQRFAVGGFGPLMPNPGPDTSTPDNGRHNGSGDPHNGFYAIPSDATRDLDGLLAEFGGKEHAGVARDNDGPTDPGREVGTISSMAGTLVPTGWPGI